MADPAETGTEPRKRDPAALRSRRLAAGELFAKGESPTGVARSLGASVQSAVRWQEQWERNGTAALGQIARQGRPLQLSQRRFKELGEFIAGPPPRYSCLRRNRPGWTPKVLQEFILRQYGVRYHLSHCWRLMRQLSEATGMQYPPPRPKSEPAAPKTALQAEPPDLPNF